MSLARRLKKRARRRPRTWARRLTKRMLRDGRLVRSPLLPTNFVYTFDMSVLAANWGSIRDNALIPEPDLGCRP